MTERDIESLLLPFICAIQREPIHNYAADMQRAITDLRSALSSSAQTKGSERDAERMADAIVWALGYTDFVEPEHSGTLLGKYWWRSELRTFASCRSLDEAISRTSSVSIVPDTGTQEGEG